MTEPSTKQLWLFTLSTAVVCWMGMMLVHESGHVLAALATGGQIERVVFYPTLFSRTDFTYNPHPLPVVWAGPIFGAVAPAIAWLITRAFTRRMVLLQLFAGWCLIANGLYIGVGSFLNIADPKEMIKHGSPVWLLWLFALVAMPPGLWLWHTLGKRFGVRPDSVRPWEVGLAVVLAVALLLAGPLLFGKPPPEGW